MKNTNQSKRAQTMAEYIIVVALVAVLSIPIVGMLGNVFRDRVINMADEMIDNAAHVEEKGKGMVEKQKENVKRTMSSFGKSKSDSD